MSTTISTISLDEAISANVNGRSLVKQLNHILRDHFKASGIAQPAAAGRKP